LNKSLKIVFVSYEYPPDTSGGGIGTYTEQMARLLSSHGNKVTVICGTQKEDYKEDKDLVEVIRLKSSSSEEFRNTAANKFRAIHETSGFDVMESPEYGAAGFYIKQRHPSLPYIVNLHTPTYILQEFNDYFRQYIYPKKKWMRFKTAARKLLGLRHYPYYNYKTDIEYQNLKLADLIVSPSRGLANKIKKDWGIPLSQIDIIPNLYLPSQALLDIPVSFEHKRVTFIGMLSILKGMVDFIKLIPEVAAENPDVKFRFIGKDSFSPDKDKTMKEFILEACSPYADRLEFTGKVELSSIPGYLSETDILVCNSLWENYPTVILEAMSAGRLVIGTSTGGIPEMIENGRNGFLVPVKNPALLAKKINWCYRRKDEAIKIAANARKSILKNSSRQAYEEIYLKYSRAIEKCRNH
jgi:glycosyltransferase involved in cell wall biosynthesis